MPPVTPRTRTVETKTTEEQPVEAGRAGLGGPCFEYLSNLSDEQLDLTSVKLYRTDPPGQQGYI